LPSYEFTIYYQAAIIAKTTKYAGQKLHTFRFYYIAKIAYAGC